MFVFCCVSASESSSSTAFLSIDGGSFPLEAISLTINSTVSFSSLKPPSEMFSLLSLGEKKSSTGGS